MELSGEYGVGVEFEAEARENSLIVHFLFLISNPFLFGKLRWRRDRRYTCTSKLFIEKVEYFEAGIMVRLLRFRKERGLEPIVLRAGE